MPSLRLLLPFLLLLTSTLATFAELRKSELTVTCGVIYQTDTTLAIERAKTFYPKKISSTQLLQTGPFLLENS